ncbi:hypothetical protein DIZ27_06390 [Streptomyces sp. NWU339]|uniref:hypothetical protein n=1 Tax=Streptomyces sp. NWU339 TaxID=2185284 RepID=UPI000D6814FD|nr:hypothetical protein [Streptomyces sp. NWU339]PWI11635.1 hypothetical protein DIZ27_06390 [Streptomyces sp. NWU339]
MVFGAEELRVLRRALALALHPTSASAEDVQDCLRLADSLDEAMREYARLRAFLVADLGRYRAALPGTAAGYLALLEEVLGAGYRPDPDDLAALRALRGNPTAAALLDRCRLLAEQDVRARLAGRTVPAAAPLPGVPVSRTRLLALPGGQAQDTEGAEGSKRPERSERPERPAETEKPEKNPEREPSAPRPEPAPNPAPAPGAPKPGRPFPTPGEVFPRRKPAPPPSGRRLAVG